MYVDVDHDGITSQFDEMTNAVKVTYDEVQGAPLELQLVMELTEDAVITHVKYGGQTVATKRETIEEIAARMTSE